eukprot:10787177-Alexandrium_andersonii.AAC.1
MRLGEALSARVGAPEPLARSCIAFTKRATNTCGRKFSLPDVCSCSPLATLEGCSERKVTRVHILVVR